MPRPSLTIEERATALGMMGGDMSDAQIAKQFGVSDQTIGRLRRKNGIPAIPVNAPRFSPTEQQIAELHETSDREMERRYGVWKETWRKVRKRFGIPRFRPPTTINGVPNKWVGKPPRKPVVPMSDYFQPAPIPPRDTSLYGEAAAYLQREGFIAYNRKKIGMGEGWQVGHSVLGADDMLAKARKLGFQQEEWMV